MEFFIRQGASDPILKMRMIDDGKNDKSSFNDLLENAEITFDMYDSKTGEPMVLASPCNITTRTKLYNQTTDEYYIVYRFTSEQTPRLRRSGNQRKGPANGRFSDLGSRCLAGKINQW